MGTWRKDYTAHAFNKAIKDTQIETNKPPKYSIKPTLKTHTQHTQAKNTEMQSYRSLAGQPLTGRFLLLPPLCLSFSFHFICAVVKYKSLIKKRS